MITAVDIDETRDYVCKADRDNPAAEQTTWKLGAIDSITMGKLDRMDVEFNPDTQDTKVQANILGREIEFVRHGLKGWANFKDSKGNEVKENFLTVGRVGGSVKQVHDDVLRRIPISVIKELAQAIREQNVLGDAERKN